MSRLGYRKQFCKRNHDTFKTGRYNGGHCRICAIKIVQDSRLKHLSVRKRTENAYADRRTLELYELKMSPCYDCKHWYNPWQMQFDHLPDFKKECILKHYSRNSILFWNEIVKCQLVCANCHWNRTYRRVKYVNG